MNYESQMTIATKTTTKVTVNTDAMIHTFFALCLNSTITIPSSTTLLNSINLSRILTLCYAKEHKGGK